MDRTEAIDGEVGLPVGWSFPMTRGYGSISTPAWCLPKVSSHGGLACLTLTSHSVALGGSDIKIRCARSHQTWCISQPGRRSAVRCRWPSEASI
jgi:hypothetical protein